MARSLALCVCLALAACGGQPTASTPDKTDAAAGPSPLQAFYKDQPRVTLPLTAPDGSEPDLKDFLEICSRGLMDANQGLAEAAKRGWAPVPEAMVTAAATGMLVLTRAGGDMSQGQIQMLRADYPHLQSRSCVYMRFQQAVPETISFAPMGKLANVQGKIDTLPGATAGAVQTGGQRGMYSFVTPDGQVVSVTLLHAPPILLNMTMNTARYVQPAAPAKP